MIILNPLEPWPGELCLGAAAAARRAGDHAGRRLRRAVLRRSACPARSWPAATTAGSARPAGSRRGRERLDAMRPIAERAGLTMIQLACQWNLAHGPVACVVPTLIQEVGRRRPPGRGQARRAGRAARPSCASPTRTSTTIRPIGDNTGCMALKGASPEHAGEERPDRWADGRAPRRTVADALAHRPGPRLAWRVWRERRRTGRPGDPADDRRLWLRRGPLRGDRALRGPMYCHCTRCQRRTGTARVGQRAGSRRARFAIVQPARTGLRAWKPGRRRGEVVLRRLRLGAVQPQLRRSVGVRLGAIDGDPGIRPGLRTSSSLTLPLGADPRRRPAALSRARAVRLDRRRPDAAGLRRSALASASVTSARIHSQPTDRSSTPIAAATFSHIP